MCDDHLRAGVSMRNRYVTQLGRQRGRTLTELMITTVIALALTSAVAYAYLGVSRTQRVAEELSGMSDAGAVAIHLIGDAIRQAGYGEVVGSTIALGAGDIGTYQTDTLFGAQAHLRGCSAGQFADPGAAEPMCAAGPADTNFDSLMVRYQGDAQIPPPQGDLTDCTGTAVPLEPLPAGHLGTARAAARPIVQNIYFGRAGGLHCQGNGRTALADPNAPPQELVANIEQFKVFYGFDDARFANPATAQSPSIRSLRDAAFINGLDASRNPWDYVVSVHVCLVVRSSEVSAGRLTVSSPVSYQRCPMNEGEARTGTISMSSTDGVLRRTYTQVFAVRARTTAGAGS